MRASSAADSTIQHNTNNGPSINLATHRRLIGEPGSCTSDISRINFLTLVVVARSCASSSIPKLLSLSSSLAAIQHTITTPSPGKCITSRLSLRVSSKLFIKISKLKFDAHLRLHLDCASSLLTTLYLQLNPSNTTPEPYLPTGMSIVEAWSKHSTGFDRDFSGVLLLTLSTLHRWWLSLSRAPPLQLSKFSITTTSNHRTQQHHKTSEATLSMIQTSQQPTKSLFAMFCLWLYTSKFEHWVASPSLSAFSSLLLQLKGSLPCMLRTSAMHCSTVPCILLSFFTYQYITLISSRLKAASISSVCFTFSCTIPLPSDSFTVPYLTRLISSHCFYRTPTNASWCHCTSSALAICITVLSAHLCTLFSSIFQVHIHQHILLL